MTVFDDAVNGYAELSKEFKGKSPNLKRFVEFLNQLKICLVQLSFLPNDKEAHTKVGKVTSTSNSNYFFSGTCPCKRYYRNGCPLLNCITWHSFIQQIYCPAQIVLFRLSKPTKVIFQITVIRSQSSMVSLKVDIRIRW